MKKVFIYGAYDLDNLGDDYMMYQVDKKMKESNIIPVYRTSARVCNYFNIKEENQLNFPKSNNSLILLLKTFKWIICGKDIKDIDAVICMGGGYTNECFGLQNILRLYSVILKFKLHQKKIYFTGQTVGPAKKRIYKKLIKKIYSSANRVFVREPFSKELLDSMNIKSELVGDDAFLAVSRKKIVEKKEDYMVFNYKDFPKYSEYREKYFKFLEEIAFKYNKKIYIVPFRSDINSKEYKINFELSKYLNERGINAEFKIERNVSKFEELLQNSSMVIGTAYHSIVLGLIYDNTVYSAYVGEYYKMKIKGILQWYGIDETNSINMSDLVKNIEIFVSNIELNTKIQNHQRKISENIYNNVNNAWNEIIKDIEK